MLNITLISLDNLGMNDHIRTTLEREGHNVKHINFKHFKYKYPSVFHKIHNFILKAFFKTNLKHQHHGREIIKELEKNEKQDVILTIKGDFIDPKSTLEFKKHAKKTIGFFNDNIYRCPNIKRVLDSYDEVYSFEKEDCEKFDLKFASNWIYTKKEDQDKNTFEYDVFTICSIDKRLPILIRIAEELRSKKINFKFIAFSKKHKPSDDHITYINKFLTLSEVDNYVSKSKVLMDINRDGQIGLTFRVFESLGLEKKLITTNADIKNYDFYNPNNILIIDEKNPVIPKSFFENEYEKIPDEIFNKYTVEGWIKNVVY